MSDTKKVTTIKFEESELQELKNITTKYQEKQGQFGQLKIQLILNEQQKEQIESALLQMEDEYLSIQQSERDLTTKLNEKYGPGTLNPETGEFTPQPQR